MVKIFSGHYHYNLSFAAILSFLLFFSGFLLTRCARQGSPAGGPQDESPAEILSETPPNRTVYYTSDQIIITFNEFIQLKDPAKEIFISPPMKTRPEFKVQGKKLIVEFKENLKANSTYTLNFGSSIIDFTEGNPLINYEYVFSTGGHIDSLSIPGKILNAFDHKPEENIIVMVYQDENDTIPLDSLPLMVQPKSASKTTKDGIFRINNLASGEYKLFALEDMNNNYIFDLPGERIAFLDSLVVIEPLEPPADPADPEDSVMMPSTAMEVLSEDSYTMYLFEEIDSTQKLLSKKLIGSNLLQYIFRMPADSAKIDPVGFQPGIPDWYIREFSKMKDTVNFWLKTGLPDTIRVQISEGDSLTDTTRFILAKATFDRPGRKKEPAVASLGVSSNTVAGAFDLNKNLILSFSKPVEDFDPGKLRLFTPTDTIIPGFSFPDTLQKQGIIEYKWSAGESYHLLIEDSAFCDLSISYNDSTSFKFKVRSAEDYGILLMNVYMPDLRGQLIIQLMSEKETILGQQIMLHSGILRFDYLLPGNYKLKAIFDTNLNEKWDTGNYRSGSLPEKVEYYMPALTIRANWDLQEDWKIE